MNRTDKDSPSMKVLMVLNALTGYTVQGVANTVLAKQLGMTPSTITRAMQALIRVGWARKDQATERFHPTPALAQLLFRVLTDITRAEQALADIKHNFSRQ